MLLLGLTNGVLARWTKAVYLAMAVSARKDNAFRHTKHIEVTGNPIRPAIAAFPRQDRKLIRNSDYRQTGKTSLCDGWKSGGSSYQ